MYPLGLASQKDTPDGWQGERFYFLLQDEACKGFDEPQEWTVREWLDDQGIDEYDRWGEGFKELTLHEFFEKGGVLSPEKMHMLFTACYDLDKFREFVFESTLLQRFEVDEDFVEEMRYDDEALLRFAFLWLRFSLFGEQTVKVKADVAEAFKGKLDKKELFDKESAEKTSLRSRKGSLRNLQHSRELFLDLVVAQLLEHALPVRLQELAVAGVPPPRVVGPLAPHPASGRTPRAS